MAMAARGGESYDALVKDLETLVKEKDTQSASAAVPLRVGANSSGSAFIVGRLLQHQV